MKTLTPEETDMPARKRSTTIRVSEECRRLMEELSSTLGVSQAAVMELAVRKLARAELPGEAAAEVKPPTKRRKRK